MASKPIPRELAEGFRDALSFYRTSWSPAAHGPEVSIGQKPYTIRAVCALVEPFTDTLPENVLITLYGCMDSRHAALRKEIVASPTYKVASQCFLKLIQDREAEYRQLESWRGERS
jgi:hypothetical protein